MFIKLVVSTLSENCWPCRRTCTHAHTWAWHYFRSLPFSVVTAFPHSFLCYFCRRFLTVLLPCLLMFWGKYKRYGNYSMTHTVQVNIHVFMYMYIVYMYIQYTRKKYLTSSDPWRAVSSLLALISREYTYMWRTTGFRTNEFIHHLITNKHLPHQKGRARLFNSKSQAVITCTCTCIFQLCFTQRTCVGPFVTRSVPCPVLPPVPLTVAPSDQYVCGVKNDV